MTPDLTADSPGETPKQAPSTAGMTTKVVKGSIWTLAGQVAPLAVSLITTPFVIRMLGAEGYGVYILVALIPTYLTFADFGMSMASTKFASEAYAEGDPAKEARIVRTSALIALCGSVPIAGLLMLFADSLVLLFNVPVELRAEGSLALRIAAVTFVVNFLNSVLNTPQLTRLRMDLNTLVNGSGRILVLIGTPILLYLGFTLSSVVFLGLLGGLFTLLAHIFVSSKQLPNLFRRGFDFTVLPRLLSFGSFWAIGGVAAVLLLNAEKGILTSLASPRELAYYSVAFTFASMMTMFATAMLQSLVPAFSQLQSDDRQGQLNSLFERGVRLNLIAIIPVMFVFALSARSLLSVWAGEEFGVASTLPFLILLVGVGFNVVAFFPYSAMAAAGRADLLTLLYWVELVPHLVLGWILVGHFGIVGAAVTWTLRTSLDVFLMQHLTRRFAQITFQYGYILKMLAVPVAIMAAIVTIAYLFHLRLTILIPLGACGLAAYFLYAWKQLLNHDEKSWISLRLKGKLVFFNAGTRRV